MQAKAKTLKGEVKAEKHKEAYERQKAAKRASYAADRSRTRHLASQEENRQMIAGCGGIKLRHCMIASNLVWCGRWYG